MSRTQDVEQEYYHRRGGPFLLKAFSAVAILGCLSLGVLEGCKSHKQRAVTQLKISQPILLHAAAQPAFQVTKSVVARAGAVLDTSDGEGTHYRLTLPPGALVADATITMTPLSNIQGMPGQTRAYGVDIAPAGTILKQFAHLEISPRQALPPHGLYWLETRGSPSSITASVGFLPKDAPGMLLIHFSGATAVVGGAATARATLQNLGDPTGVIQQTDGQRAQAEQAYESGQISKEARDRIDDLCDDKIQSDAARYTDPSTILDAKTKEVESELDDLGPIVDAGNLDSLGAIQQAVIDALKVDRQDQLFGKQTDIWEKIGQLFDRYYKALLANCDKHPIPLDTLLGMEQQAQMRGHGLAGTPEYEKCKPKMFVASGGGDGLSVYGEVKDPTKPFALRGTFPGANADFNFTPTGPGGGTSSYTASGSGVTGHGTGTYTIKRLNDDWVVIDVEYGCVDGIPGSCRTTTSTITLSSTAAH